MTLPVARIPVAIPIKAGQQFALDVTLKDEAGDPINLVGWTCRFSIAEDVGGSAIVETFPVGTDQGLIPVRLTRTQTLLLQPYACSCVVMQIDADAVVGTIDHRINGRLQVSQEILA